MSVYRGRSKMPKIQSETRWTDDKFLLTFFFGKIPEMYLLRFAHCTMPVVFVLHITFVVRRFSLHLFSGTFPLVCSSLTFCVRFGFFFSVVLQFVCMHFTLFSLSLDLCCCVLMACLELSSTASGALGCSMITFEH